MRSRDGEKAVFHSSLVPPYVRRTTSLDAALLWLYLKGISSGQIQAALDVLVRPEVKGLSASVVSRLRQWHSEYDDWRRRDLGKDRSV